VGNAASNGPVQLNRRRIAGGGVLIGIGGLLGFTGMLLVSAAIISAARQRVNQLEQPPSELAKRTWQQARAATTAGAKAWRTSPSAKVSSYPFDSATPVGSDAGQWDPPIERNGSYGNWTGAAHRVGVQASRLPR